MFIALSLNHYLMSVVKSIILAPIHPKSASYNWCLRILQCSWERGEWGPGWRPAKKGQHGRRVFVDVIAVSSSNNKCLQDIEKMCWVGLTPVGRAAQAWAYLLSGSWGSSSTKPLMLYLKPLLVQGTGRNRSKSGPYFLEVSCICFQNVCGLSLAFMTIWQRITVLQNCGKSLRQLRS